MGKLNIDAGILRMWEESKQGVLPEKLDDAALEFEMMFEAHEDTIKNGRNENGPAETLFSTSKAYHRE